MLQVLQAIPNEKWNPTAAAEDYADNNISHQFWSTKHASAIIDAAVRIIGLLLPGQLNAFRCEGMLSVALRLVALCWFAEAMSGDEEV